MRHPEEAAKAVSRSSSGASRPDSSRWLLIVRNLTISIELRTSAAAQPSPELPRGRRRRSEAFQKITESTCQKSLRPVYKYILIRTLVFENSLKRTRACRNRNSR